MRSTTRGLIQTLAILSTFSTLAACRTAGASSALEAVHQRNDDVALFAVENSAPGFCYRDHPTDVTSGTCSGLTVIDADRCHELERQTNQFGTTVKRDCREEIRRMSGVRLVKSAVITGWRSTNESAFTYNDYHMLKTIRVAIKEAAFQAPSFKGLGFYVDEVTYGAATPVPNGGDVGVSYTKEELVNGALSTQHLTLRGGALADVFTVATVIHYGIGGSSGANGEFIRPYVRFESNGQEYFNWDSVASDYFVGMQVTFDRRADIAQ